MRDTINGTVADIGQKLLDNGNGDRITNVFCLVDGLKAYTHQSAIREYSAPTITAVNRRIDLIRKLSHAGVGIISFLCS